MKGPLAPKYFVSTFPFIGTLMDLKFDSFFNYISYVSHKFSPLIMWPRSLTQGVGRIIQYK
jgi:hypothetical protein